MAPTRVAVLTISNIHLLKQNCIVPISKPNFASASLYHHLNVHKSEHRKLVSIANLLQRHGFPHSQLQTFLTRNKFLVELNLQGIERSLGILTALKIPQNSLLSMIRNCPGILELEFLKKWEVGISDMGISCLSAQAIQSVLEHSKRFGISDDKFNGMVRVLKGLGFNDTIVTKILEEFPVIATMNENEIWGRIEFLMSIGLSRNGLYLILFSFPGVLGLHVEDRLKPLFEEFTHLGGFSMDLVRKEILREPRILSLELGELSRSLEFLKTFKCRPPIKSKILREGVFRAAYEVKKRVDCLCRYGLIRGEAFKVLWKEPRVILYNVKDTEKKIEFLLHNMKYDIGWLADAPEYLGVNFEKQIAPRHGVMEYLRSKGGLGSEVGLKDLIKPSRLNFYNLYVKPYPECQNLFGRFSNDREGRRKHPEGLFKIFAPPKYSDSKEDIENMKVFMEL